ncbi:MAG TPA: IPT/TIG domain-containing protein [Parasegetibacter sp.]
MKKFNWALMLFAGLVAIMMTISSCSKSNLDDEDEDGDPPVITSVSPSSASIGQSITISGTGLKNPTVEIATKVATVTSSTNTSIVTVIPNGIALGAASLRVTTANGTVVYSGTLTIQ